MKIKSVSEALQLFKYILRQVSGEVVSTAAANFGRHRLVYARLWYRGVPFNVKFYLVYQRKPFESFEKFFDFPSKAYTVNKSIIEYCLKMKVHKLIFIDEVGNVYMVDPLVAYKVAKEKGWIRKTKKTGEVVVHIPTVLMTKIEYKEPDKKIISYF